MSRITRSIFSVSAVTLLGLLPIVGIPVAMGPGSNGSLAVAQAQESIPATGNLALHKYLTATPGAAGDGTELGAGDLPNGATPAEGVNFNLYRVHDEADQPIDLTDPNDWALADDVELADLFHTGARPTVDNINPARLGDAQTGTTNAEGLASWNDLPAGLYLVVEQSNQQVNGQQLVPSVPFIVQVPMTNPEGNGWLDIVHVYPKNQSFDAETALGKTISDPEPDIVAGVNRTGSSHGEMIQYTLSATLPELPAGQTLSGLVISDKLDAVLGVPQDVVVSVAGAPQTIDVDYELVNHEINGQQVLAVRFLDTADLTNGAAVTVVFDTEVEDIPTAPINNRGYILAEDTTIDTAWDPEVDGGTPGGEVSSKYGNIIINKTGQADGGTVGVGATFELHRCTAAGGIPMTDAPIEVGGQTEFTTTGTASPYTVAINGIHLGNVDTTGTYTDIWAGQGPQFCLVEISTDNGWSLLPKPVTVELTADASTTDIPVATANIENFRSNFGVTLPLTGGVGIWALIIAGLGVMISGIWWNVRNRRAS